jgi:hypothetical protein
MLLSELFERLALGELSQHKYGKNGVIEAADYPAIIHQLNIGLTKLYTRFPLSTKELIVEQYDTIKGYMLSSEYAQTNEASTQETKYILDCVENPFTDDLLRVNAVYTGCGKEIALNDGNAECSWFLPLFNQLQIPEPVLGELALVVYQAKHPKIATDAALTTVINIPSFLEEALQAYIASRCFISLGNQSSGALSAYFSNLYEERVNAVDRMNMLPLQDMDGNSKLIQKGFM